MQLRDISAAFNEYHDDGVYLGVPDDTDDIEDALGQFQLRWMANLGIQPA